MGVSSLDLATVRTRVAQMLMDAGLAVINNDVIDHGARLALMELGRVRPRVMWWPYVHTTTTTARFLEVGWTSAYRGSQITGVYAPYDATQAWPNGLNNARLIPHSLLTTGVDSTGTPTIELAEAVAVSTSTAKVIVQFRYPVLALKDLDSAAASTFFGEDDTGLLLGACGYACQMVAVDKIETATENPVTSVGGGLALAPSDGYKIGGTQTYAVMSGKAGMYAAMGATLLAQFRGLYPEKRVARSRRFRGVVAAELVWNPDTLGV